MQGTGVRRHFCQWAPTITTSRLVRAPVESGKPSVSEGIQVPSGSAIMVAHQKITSMLLHAILGHPPQKKIARMIDKDMLRDVPQSHTNPGCDCAACAQNEKARAITGDSKLPEAKVPGEQMHADVCVREHRQEELFHSHC